MKVESIDMVVNGRPVAYLRLYLQAEDGEVLLLELDASVRPSVLLGVGSIEISWEPELDADPGEAVPE